MEPQNNIQPEPSEAESKELAVSAADVDYFLQMEVEEANLRTEPYLPITLQVRGLIVTGTLISGDRYFDTIASSVKGEGEGVESSREFYRGLGERYRKSRASANPFEGDPPIYIHLENASIMNAPGMTKLKVLWRGRISSVDGWFTGILE